MDESPNPPIPPKPGRRWLRLLDRWLVGAYEDNATGLAAQLSYDFIFLLAPGPLLVSALLSIFGTDPTTLANIIALLKSFLPELAHPIIDRQISAIVVSGITTKFAYVGICLALYLGLNFINTFTRSLNHTLGVREMKRPWWSRWFIALLLLFWFSFTILFSFNVLVFGEQVAANIVNTFKLEIPLETIVAYTKYPSIIVALVLLALTLYLLTPEIYQTVRQALPGAIFFALGWLGSTYLFRVYVEQFARYGENYLSFSSLVVLLTWIYVTSLLLLLGGRLNLIIRQEWYGEDLLRSTPPTTGLTAT
ncbi:hypothetical protein AYO41_01985 [Verrucomicrobia bacterium SCGC AG-212-E04]|nr:hypothetical protein AYO41_01985 [Verrucomicrobia bacterium SCGC AG-212-E04]